MQNIKVMRRLLCLLLCAILVFGMTACKDKQGDSLAEEDVWVITDPTTNTYIVKNGVSPYKILIPENYSDQLYFAATEMQYFFELITGV